MPQTLAQMVRAKHPGVYDDLSDDDLESKVSAKFPGVYDDIPRTSAKTDRSAGQNLALGALKGAGSLALTALQTTPVALGQRAVAAFSGRPDPMQQRIEQGQQALAPEGTAQNIGSGVVRAVPSVALAALSGGASIPIQAGAQAALSGAQSQAQTPAGVATDTALGAAGVYWAVAVSGVVKRAAALGVREYIKALAPTKEATKDIAQKIAPELIRRGVTGSIDKLLKTGRANVSEVGAQLRETYMAATKGGATVDATQIAKGLEALKRPFVSVDPAGKEIVLHQGAVSAITALQETLDKFGAKAAPDQLWKFRKVLDDVIQSSNGFTQPLSPFTAKALARQARAEMQTALSKAVPGVERINPEYGLWKGLTDVASATSKRKAGQSGIVGDVLRATAAGGVGTAALGPGGIAAAGVPYVYTRPAVRTAVAVGLNRLGAIPPVSRLTLPSAGRSLRELIEGRE
jgi:hypothetical protein